MDKISLHPDLMLDDIDLRGQKKNVLAIKRDLSGWNIRELAMFYKSCGTIESGRSRDVSRSKIYKAICYSIEVIRNCHDDQPILILPSTRRKEDECQLAVPINKIIC